MVVSVIISQTSTAPLSFFFNKGNFISGKTCSPYGVPCGLQVLSSGITGNQPAFPVILLLIIVSSVSITVFRLERQYC